ncbi:hypothetical protein LRL17_30640 (plasmid) [Rhodococcus qingshengii]|uniref:hypothetical protein n=2 Tax=Rhodococcus TaxID=1827 RepID=UPI001E567233|nr:hypothetical protein [Rhodococcus qingshengii]UGQ55373.1 hypothetical protein LRL17_30640 [Rhodococcus qingshengii]
MSLHSPQKPWQRATHRRRDTSHLPAHRDDEFTGHTVASDRKGPKPLTLLDPIERAELLAATKSKNKFVAFKAQTLIKFDDNRRIEMARRSAALGGLSPLKSSDRGLIGERGGRVGPVSPLVEYRATTIAAAGLWPFPVGAGAPLVGVPVGSHLYTGAPVCFDPLSWMTRAKFLHQPSMMLLGLPGFGKSTLARKIMLGLIYNGVTALVLGDLKPDYVKLVETIDGGQNIKLGLGLGQMNPLDMGPLGQILPVLDAAARDESRPAEMREKAAATALIVRARIGGDRLSRTKALLELTRNRTIEDYEEAALSAALEFLNETITDRQPLLEDLLGVLKNPPASVVDAYQEETQLDYLRECKPLRRTLNALMKGAFGEVFNGHTTEPININAPAVCVDVSGISRGARKLKGAVLLTCWEHGFAATDAAHYLSDAGLGPKRNFLVVLDEMWQVLRAGVGMVERVDELTRLNRVWGTALLMCTHTVSDLQSLPDPADVEIAKGFVERAGALVVGALPRKEMARLADIKPFTETEIADITSWSSPPALTGDSRSHSAPPGQGKFFIKVGEQGAPGIPLRTVLFPSEIASGVHDTNTRFDLDREWEKEYESMWAAA